MQRTLLSALLIVAVLAVITVAFWPGSEPPRKDSVGRGPISTEGPPPQAPQAPQAPEDVEEIDASEEEVEEEAAEKPGEKPTEDLVTSAFDSQQWNTAVGLGGGAGGKWGARYGGRAWRRPALVLGERASGDSYSEVDENDFKSTLDSPISTFGVDVDTASYTNIRRILKYGQLPLARAVRVEELINYFSYDYPKPVGKDCFSITTEKGPCPWNKDHELVLIGWQGKTIDADKTPPCNLVFLIDVSGSMSPPDKLPLVKRTLARLVKGLTDRDMVAIVTYAGETGVALPPTSAEEKKSILDCISELGAGGGTNGAGGIKAAYELARQNYYREHSNRVILVTDGDFNVGTVRREDLGKLIEKERESGVFLTVVGVGSGNLRHDIMSTLAKRGNGQYLYLDSAAEARRQFGKNLTGTLVTIAKDVKLQVEFNPKTVAGYRLVGYERRILSKEDFRNDKKDSGEIGAGHAVTALYEIVPRAGHSEPEAQVLEVRLRCKTPWAKKAREFERKMTSDAGATDNLAFASAVAILGMVLSKSDHHGDSTLETAAELARRSLGKDPDGRRAEFVRIATEAAVISQLGPSTMQGHAERTQAIEEGLEWLKNRQNADGSWGGKTKDWDCPLHDIGLTGLAMLAFTGEGSSIRSGRYKNTLEKGVIWLRENQTGDGLFRSEDSKGAILDHAIATLALAEAWVMSKSKLLKKTTFTGHEYLSNHLGTGKGDISTLGWHILVTESLKTWGTLGSSRSELQARARKILARPTDKRRNPDVRNPVSLLDQFMLRGRTRKVSEPEPPAADSIIASIPDDLKELQVDDAYWYFSGTAIEKLGGKYLDQWNRGFISGVVETQRRDGSWNSKGAAKSAGARIHATAMMVLTLEVPDRRGSR